MDDRFLAFLRAASCSPPGADRTRPLIQNIPSLDPTDLFRQNHSRVNMSILLESNDERRPAMETPPQIERSTEAMGLPGPDGFTGLVSPPLFDHHKQHVLSSNNQTTEKGDGTQSRH